MPHFIFIQQISVLNILNMLYNLHFFSLQDAVYFITLHIFGSCITHILNTGVLKFEEKKIRRQKVNVKRDHRYTTVWYKLWSGHSWHRRSILIFSVSEQQEQFRPSRNLLGGNSCCFYLVAKFCKRLVCLANSSFWYQHVYVGRSSSRNTVWIKFTTESRWCSYL